jgi:hypothetical protein
VLLLPLPMPMPTPPSRHLRPSSSCARRDPAPVSALPLWSYLELLNLRRTSDEVARLVGGLAAGAPHAALVGGGSGRAFGAAAYGAPAYGHPVDARAPGAAAGAAPGPQAQPQAQAHAQAQAPPHPQRTFASVGVGGDEALGPEALAPWARAPAAAAAKGHSPE